MFTIFGDNLIKVTASRVFLTFYLDNSPVTPVFTENLYLYKTYKCTKFGSNQIEITTSSLECFKAFSLEESFASPILVPHFLIKSLF